MWDASKCECSKPVSKAYMTTSNYTFLGTLINAKSFNDVTHQKLPQDQHRGSSAQKTKRESTVLKKLEAATKGQYKEQFSNDRLADAIAICKHEWSHFNTSEGRLNPDKRWLPSQLASRMKHDGRRGLQSPHSQLSALAQAARSDAAILLDDVEESVPNVVQRCHFGRKLYGLSAGVPVKKVVAQKILTLDEFKKRPVTLGSFVITRTAPSGKWNKQNPKLAELAFWMWHVIRVIRPGEAIPGKNKLAETFVYDAHLHQPKKGRTGSGSWSPLFTDDRVYFMRTGEEKARHTRRKLVLRRGTVKKQQIRVKRDLSDTSDDGEFLRPIRCLLRPQNIVGGGFGRTATGAIPNAIRKHAMVELAVTA